MAISFNNIPDSIRTPGTYAEVDASRALQGLSQNPHKVLIIGQKIAAGTAASDAVMSITSDGLANGFFGPGSILARMCNTFKKNNPNTELHAMAIGSGIAGTAASGTIDFSLALSATTASAAGTYNLLINGKKVYFDITIGMSGYAIASGIASTINADSTLPVTATLSGVAAGSGGHLTFSAVNSGTVGNYIDIRTNYFTGESTPLGFSRAPSIVAMAGGATDPDLGDVWAVIDNTQYQYIIQPYIDSANLTEIEDELSTRFGPLVDLQGHGFTAVRATTASATTLGNSRNSPHNTIIAANDSPTGPEEWAAAVGAIAAFNLNNDPARPLHTLGLDGIQPPPIASRFTRSERDILLYDGIATFIVDTGGKVRLERCITTYQTNALGISDPTYLDIQTLATLGEIRYQYKVRMSNRFIIPRFKLADNTFPVQPGSFVATPNLVKAEVISLFSQLEAVGLIENMDAFKSNLVVERDPADRNRVNVLLPPDLINQFRVLAGLIQFIL